MAVPSLAFRSRALGCLHCPAVTKDAGVNTLPSDAVPGAVPSPLPCAPGLAARLNRRPSGLCTLVGFGLRARPEIQGKKSHRDAPRPLPEGSRPLASVGRRPLLSTCGQRCTQTSRLCLHWLSTAPDFVPETVSSLLEDAAGARMTPWPVRGHPERPHPEGLASESELAVPRTRAHDASRLFSPGTDRQTRGPRHAGRCRGKAWGSHRPWPPASGNSVPRAGSVAWRGLGDGYGRRQSDRPVNPWPWATRTVTIPIMMQIRYEPQLIIA